MTRLGLALLAQLALAIRKDQVEQMDVSGDSVTQVLDQLVDLTPHFTGPGVLHVAGKQFRCCKKNSEDHGIVVDASPREKEPLFSGCRGYVGLLYKSYTETKSPKCLAWTSGLPAELSTLGADVVETSTITVPKVMREAGQQVWSLSVKLIDPRVDMPLRGMQVRAMSSDSTTLFGMSEANRTGWITFTGVPFGSDLVQLRPPEGYKPAQYFYDKKKSCEDSESCFTQLAVAKV
ncbi:unnamed protein product [Durusdinium trenchii]|uniref:Uncharacterized protein n=1 Tax=Durusdinium trenchii TaxID=1381693 RepID=A0ABP0NLH9_9DINO